MNDNKHIEKKKEIISEKIIEGNIFSFIQTYAFFFFGIFSSFLIARILSAEEWGYYILAISTVLTYNIITKIKYIN